MTKYSLYTVDTNLIACLPDGVDPEPIFKYLEENAGLRIDRADVCVEKGVFLTNDYHGGSKTAYVCSYRHRLLDVDGNAFKYAFLDENQDEEAPLRYTVIVRNHNLLHVVPKFSDPGFGEDDLEFIESEVGFGFGEHDSIRVYKNVMFTNSPGIGQKVIYFGEGALMDHKRNRFSYAVVDQDV